MNQQSLPTSGARLLHLSNEVSKIASDLVRMSVAPRGRENDKANENILEISASQVMAIMRARRLRANYFPDDLFADPAWDMMLDLLHSELSYRRVSVSSLCTAASVPATTALRWINAMVQKGLFVRHADPLDGRRIFIELAPETSAALRNYFAEVRAAPGI
jgi:hypothetical protein